ncbi:outer membrane protein assembly factor BamE domain-containing protein [Cupriavidus necator]
MRKVVLAATVSVILAGCAASGTNFTVQDANKIQNGMTRDQIIQVMGSKPTSIANGGKRFIWSYAKVGFMGGTESRAVRFDFDENGKAYGIPEGGVYGDTAKFQ